MQSQVRLICAAVVAALAVSASGLATGAGNSAANRAEGLIAANPGWANRVAGDTFEFRGVVVDNDGTEHVRYNRSYKGLPVIGGDLVVHSKGGNLKSMTQWLNNMTRPGLGAKVKADDAIVAAGVDFGGGFDGKPTARKVIYAMYSKPTLAWEVVMKGTRSDQTFTEMHYFVDANSGAVLDAWDMVHTAAANGTGNTGHIGSVPLTTNSVSGGFQMVDAARGNGSTLDANGVVYSSAAGSAVLFTDADNTWGNGNFSTDRATAAADAHFGVAITWDYFKNTHGRNGIFNNGQGVKSFVHVGSNWVNASWYGNNMYYGDGDGTTYAPLVTLDIAGHEMSHGVTQATSGLAYSGDMGGLNEGTSDIFGTLVEYYASNSSDPGDYLIGEKIYKSNPSGTKAMRYMFKQNIDGRSYVCYPSRGFRREDPHFTSGVANRFFYLLAEGAVVPAGFGSGTSYNLTPASLVCNGNTGLSAIGRAKAGAIWYRALDLYFTSSTKYSNARTATLNAARDLYGSGSPEYNAVAAAWSATNVN